MLSLDNDMASINYSLLTSQSSGHYRIPGGKLIIITQIQGRFDAKIFLDVCNLVATSEYIAKPLRLNIVTVTLRYNDDETYPSNPYIFLSTIYCVFSYSLLLWRWLLHDTMFKCLFLCLFCFFLILFCYFPCVCV